MKSVAGAEMYKIRKKINLVGLDGDCGLGRDLLRFVAVHHAAVLLVLQHLDFDHVLLGGGADSHGFPTVEQQTRQTASSILT